jgi:hypothetical protein
MVPDEIAKVWGNTEEGTELSFTSLVLMRSRIERILSTSRPAM